MPDHEKKKRLVVVAGIYGAGKSTFINNHLRPELGDAFHYLLPDDLVQAYGYQQGTPEFHHGIIEPMIRGYLKSGKPLLYETTLTSKNDEKWMPGDPIGLDDYLDHMPCDFDRIRLAKEQGYDVELYYIGLGSPEKHNQFVAEREALGGSPIDFKYIKNRYNKSLRNLPIAMLLADKTHLIDNSNKNFKKVGELVAGKVVYLKDPFPSFIEAIETARSGSTKASVQELLASPIREYPERQMEM